MYNVCMHVYGYVHAFHICYRWSNATNEFTWKHDRIITQANFMITQLIISTLFKVSVTIGSVLRNADGGWNVEVSRNYLWCNYEIFLSNMLRKCSWMTELWERNKRQRNTQERLMHQESGHALTKWMTETLEHTQECWFSLHNAQQCQRPVDQVVDPIDSPASSRSQSSTGSHLHRKTKKLK